MIAKAWMLRHSFLYALALVTMLGLNICMGVASYWRFLDTDLPIRVDYQHAQFLSQEAHSRDDAEKFAIASAAPNATVFRYMEYCVLRSKVGTVQKAWIDGVVYQTPTMHTLAVEGCYRRSFAETVPPLPGHLINLSVKVVFENNPLRSIELVNPSIPILVRR